MTIPVDVKTTSATTDVEGPAVRRCPSAQPDMPDPQVLGVVEFVGDRQRVAYIDESVPVTPDLLALAGDVEPTEVMRISAECDEKKCMHFDGAQCRLASRVVEMLPAVVDALPPCKIRRDCRWFVQEGPPACQRCPQITTLTDDTGDGLLATMAYGPEDG